MTARNSILFVAGGRDVMQRTFRDRGRGYWSSQFPLVLEKHGWLDFATAEPEALADLESLAGHAFVIVAWLPAECWLPEYVETLRGYRGQLFLEGPFPPPVEQLLGIERAGEAVDGLTGSLSFSDEAAAYLDARFGSSFSIGHRSGPDPSLVVSPGGEPNPLELAPRRSVTRRPGLSRDLFANVEPSPMEANAAKAGASLVLAYAARFRQGDRFFDDPLDDALALLACVRSLTAVSQRSPLRDALRQLVTNAGGSNRRPPARGSARDALARAVWGTALAEASSALRDATFLERARDVLADIHAEWLARAPLDPILGRWRLLLALELTGAPSGRPAAAAVDAILPTGDAQSATICWLDAAIGTKGGPVVQASADRIAAVAASLDNPQNGKLPRELDGLNVPDLMLTLAALQRHGHSSAAHLLWRVLVDELYDTRDGLFFNARVVRGELEPTRGRSISPLLALGLLDAGRDAELAHPPTDALEQYSIEQRNAWAAPPYSFQPYRGVAASDAVLSLETADGMRPALWRRGNVTSTAFQLLAHLVHVHTVEPLAEPFTAFRSGDAIALEYLLVHLLGSGVQAGPPKVVTTAPWPWDTSYVVTVRHDVDRILDEKQFKRLFDFEREHDLGVSWFWLPERLDQKQLTRIEREHGHEVALHSVRLGQKPHELQLVGRAISTPIAGEAFHGSGDGWLGHPSVREAVDAGLLYTELAPPIADLPYARYPFVEPDGRIAAELIVGVTYNISIESKMGDKPGSEGGPGLYRQLLNHPDLNFDRLSTWIEALPDEPRLSWTCAEVAHWWRATHSEGALEIRHLAPDDAELRFEVVADEDIDDLELRLPCRPDSVTGVTVDDDPAEWSSFAEPEFGGVRIRLSPTARTPCTVVVHCAGERP